MKLIDSHAHLDFSDFTEDLDLVINRARDLGIEKIINIGADLERSKKSIQIADKYENIWATIGIHPEEAHKIKIDDSLVGLEKMLETSNKVVAIGECGLDYFWSEKKDENNNIKNLQKRLFEGHLELASKRNLPVVIHIRNGGDDSAAEEAYDILSLSNVHSGVVHCFTLSSDWAKKFINLGFYIGFTGIITYKNTDSIKNAASQLPISKILIETDCPFLAPQAFRGKRNEPAYVVEVAKKIAEIKDISLEEVGEATSKNAEDLFDI